MRAPMYDVFRTLSDGSPVWVKTVEGLDEAKAFLTSLALASPGEFFIYSPASGRIVDRFSWSEARPRESEWRQFSTN